MAAIASILSVGFPRRLLEQMLVEPAKNWAEAMQDLIETIVTVEVIVANEVDVKVKMLNDDKAERRFELNKLAPKSFPCAASLARDWTSPS